MARIISDGRAAVKELRILRWLFALGVFHALVAAAAPDKLDVVATSSSGGALVRELGAEQVELTILAPPDRDLHYVQVRPSMIRALRGADLVISLGADLEVGWLPVCIRQAANPRIQPGRPGYFEAAAQVSLLDAGGTADRALGDVHPLGNPHVNMDPARMATIAIALAARLGELDPEHRDDYAERAREFERKVTRRLEAWQGQVNRERPVVLYHLDANYLLERLGVPLLGLLEPVPGVPPSASELRVLSDRARGVTGVILHTPFQPEAPVRALERDIGWPSFRLPLEPPLDADGDGYLEHIDRWVQALSGNGS